MANEQINPNDLVSFLEYEEGLTKDPETAKRIKNLLIKLGIWS